MLKKIKVLTVLVVIAIHGLGCAATAERVAKPPAPAASAQGGAQTAKQPSLSVEVLEAQLEQMKSFQDAILNTVWWSLGVVVIIAFALVSFSWWNNSRNYDRDKAAIRDEIANRLGAMLVEHQEKVNERLIEEERNASSRFNGLTDELRNRVDEGIEKFVASNAITITGLKTQITTLRKDIEESLIPIRFDILEITHRVYQGKEARGAALIVLTRLMELALVRSDFWVERVLNELSIDLKADAAATWKQISAGDTYVEKMLTLLPKVPDSLQPMALELSGILNTLPPKPSAKGISA